MVGATNSELGSGPPKIKNGSIAETKIYLKEMYDVASLEPDEERN